MKEVLTTHIRGTIQLPVGTRGNVLDSRIDLEITIPTGVIAILATILGAIGGATEQEVLQAVDMVENLGRDSTPS